MEQSLPTDKYIKNSIENFYNNSKNLQTGSGKTFTITGGPERYSDRGIIPRSLSYIFQQFSRVNLTNNWLNFIFFLEIV